MDKRLQFIEWIVGTEEEGYISLAAKISSNDEWVERAFAYPEDKEGMAKFIGLHESTSDIYFCPTILNAGKRRKENISLSTCLWADLDECTPNNLLVEPSCVIQTSIGRYQAYWKLSKPNHAIDVEELNKRIAYRHEHEGADISGWDLTQLLRLPGTFNFKYGQKKHKVQILNVDQTKVYSQVDFMDYPRVEGKSSIEAVPFPKKLPDESAEDILDRYRNSINPSAWRLHTEVPNYDWSKNLWRLELILFEAGLSREEVYIVASEAACNKFERDGLSNTQDLLWKDVIRAEAHIKARSSIEVIRDPEYDINDKLLLTEDEREFADQFETVVDKYVKWAETNTDAAKEYHVASAFIILSSLLSGTVRLPTSFGTIIPNMWFMLLGDTTLTRKSTAMKMGMGFILDIISDCILGTDGTIEGLLSEISLRPNMPSIFWRDEFTGLMEQMTKRDYHAGMMESFAKLYDGDYQKRVLRRETIEVRDPILIIYAGGIKERTFQLLSFEHINSGFIPRFVFITANVDLDRIKPIGPPTTVNVTERAELLRKFEDIYEGHTFQPNDDDFLTFHKYTNATLTDEAWFRYNQFEEQMMTIGHQSSMPDLLTPMMDRLCKSGLKAAVLLAASNQTENVVVDLHYLIKAFSFVESWKMHAIEVITNAGKTASELTMERVFEAIQASGTIGMKRTTLMRTFKFTAKEADSIFTTLEQRGLIRSNRGKSLGGTIYYSLIKKVERPSAKR